MAIRTFSKEQCEAALTNPSTFFECPGDVVVAPGISDAEKIEILRCWEYDVREEEVAQEENMSGDLPVTLSHVLDALNWLGIDSAPHHMAPTKQGGQ